jgi:tetratricopeptide (TPR) repeat protein
MKSISKLKDEGRRCEQQEQWEKAITAYLQVLKVAKRARPSWSCRSTTGSATCTCGSAAHDAVGYYEQAAERYADLGLFNNAIALCNKALRFRPDRLEVLRKLGYYSVQQGFLTDATDYYLKYAEQRFRAGALDDALNALDEFANASDDPEVRELLGRRLQDFGRPDRAVKELRKAYELRSAAGQAAVAAALLEEIRALDPTAAIALESADEPVSALGEDAQREPFAAPEDATPEASPHGDGEMTAAAEVEYFEEVEDAADEEEGFGGGTLEGLESTTLFDQADFASVEVEALETENTGPDDVPTGPMEGLEPTTFAYDEYDGDSVEDDLGVAIERDERSFDEGGEPTGLEEAGDIGMDSLPLLDGQAVEGSDDADHDDEDDDAPLAEPLPLIGGELDAVIDVDVEDEPPTDFEGSVLTATSTCPTCCPSG